MSFSNTGNAAARNKNLNLAPKALSALEAEELLRRGGGPADMDRISVAIRIRPLNQREESAGTAWLWDDRTVTQCALTGRPVANAAFAFDQVFGPETTNAVVFQKVARDLVNSAMNGINATIFAYGQTSSGKTHTMKGNAEAPGVIPLSVQTLFQFIEQAPGREFLLRVAYMEIYNEEVTDLLNPASGRLAVRVDPQKGAYVEAREQIVTCPEELLKAMDLGERNRHVGATNMNEHSSRSHTIFRITIESRERSVQRSASVGGQSDAGPVKVASLHLVDLAGSERIRHTGAEGERRKEGAAINKSLLNLGLVMQKLSEGKGDREHVPYRNSKLTHILSSALGGNSRTAIVCNITPASLHADESTSTLKFASTAKLIKTRPQVNEVVDEQTLLRTYKRRLQQLEKELLEASQRATVPASAVNTSSDLVARLKEEEAKRAELQEKLERLANQFVSANSITATAKKSGSKARANRRETWAPARGADEEEPEADHTPVPPPRLTAESLALPSRVAAFNANPNPSNNPDDLSSLVPTAGAPAPSRSSNGGKSKRSVEDLEEEIRMLQRDFDHALEQLETALGDLDAEKKRPQELLVERDQLAEVRIPYHVACALTAIMRRRCSGCWRRRRRPRPCWRTSRQPVTESWRSCSSNSSWRRAQQRKDARARAPRTRRLRR
jgi:centromeric protein E